jgi:hypothetical protein
MLPRMSSFSWTTVPRPIVALAPIAGVTDSSYRQFIKKLAPESIVYTEFLSTDAIHFGAKKTLTMLDFNPALERPFIVQVFGAEPEHFLTALEKGFDFKTIVKNCEKFFTLYDAKDDVVALTDGEEYAKNLSAGFKKVTAGAPHFRTERVTEILDIILPISSIPTKAVNSEKVERELNKLIKKVTQGIENFSFNTCISSFMEFHNAIKDDFITLESVKKFLTVLYQQIILLLRRGPIRWHRLLGRA